MTDVILNTKESALAAREYLREVFPKPVLTNPKRFNHTLAHAEMFMPNGAHEVRVIVALVGCVQKAGLDPHDAAYTYPYEGVDFSQVIVRFEDGEAEQ